MYNIEIEGKIQVIGIGHPSNKIYQWNPDVYEWKKILPVELSSISQTHTGLPNEIKYKSVSPVRPVRRPPFLPTKSGGRRTKRSPKHKHKKTHKRRRSQK